jgi:AcrR family transcriptional regulator
MSATPKRTRASKLQPEQRKQQLLSSAIEVFAGKGIDSVKHADVAKSANVAAPTVFSYFPNRESLIGEVLDEVGRYVLSSVVNVKDEGDVEERLLQTGLSSIALTKEKPNYMKVWLMWGMHFAPVLQAQYRIYESQAIDKLCEIIQAGASNNDPDDDIHDRARMIMAASTQLTKMVFEGVSDERQIQYIKHIISFAKV